MQPGTHSLTEIMEQPQAWTAALERAKAFALEHQELLQAADELVCVGCGSAYHISLCLASTWRAIAGRPATPATGAEFFLFPEQYLRQGVAQLMICPSRSGETSETVRALRLGKRHGLPTIAITAYEGSPLDRASSFALYLPECREQSTITTKSVTSMIICGTVLAQVAAELDAVGELERLPEACTRLLSRYAALAEEIGTAPHLTKIAFLGSGPLFGPAQEARLKVQEAALRQAEAFPVLDFRHGPMAQVDAQTLVVAMISQAGAPLETRLLAEMKGLGATTVAIAEEATPGLADAAHYLVELRSGLNDYLRQALYLPFCHLLAYHKALSVGENPDSPRHLVYAVRLEEEVR